MPIPTALIGFGNIADVMRHDKRMRKYFPDAAHAQVLARHEAFDWVAVVDPSDEARKRAATEWGIETCVADVMDLPNREEIETAVIASPPGRRCELIAALPYLKSVLVEKPLGRTITEARSFAESCARRGISVQVNYWRRAVPAFRELAAGGLHETIGEVQAVAGIYGNGLMNNGSHLIDFLRMLCGEIETIEGCGTVRPAPGSSVENDADLSCFLRLENGTGVMLSPVDFSEWREVGLDIWGTRGRLSIMQEGLAITRYPRAENRGLENEWEIDSGAGETRPVEVGKCMQAMYDNVAAAVAGEERLLSPVPEALNTEVHVHAALELARATAGY